MKINFKNISAAVCVGLICLLLVFHFTVPNVKITIPVRYGSRTIDVIGALGDNGLILSRACMLTLFKLTKSINKVKAGMYEFNARENFFVIWRKLVSGKTVKMKVTIPEGLTIKQIAELLETKGITKAVEFHQYAESNMLEGYLFPETYFFEYFHSAKQIAGIMNKQFDRIYTPEFDEKRKRYNFSRQEHITLASIIEKETRKKEEMPLVSAVFHNRLKKRMYLESCATVQYALGGWKKRLSYKDIDIESPYNTYKRFGLPPAPICSPGIASIKAALEPADSNVLYFVADGLGGNKFYTKYSEHLSGRESLKSFRKEWNKKISK